MKDAGMRIRVEPDLRDAFLKVCHDANVPAAQVIRGFMRDFVEQQDALKPQSKLLFTNNGNTNTTGQPDVE